MKKPLKILLVTIVIAGCNSDPVPQTQPQTAHRIDPLYGDFMLVGVECDGEESAYFQMLTDLGGSFINHYNGDSGLRVSKVPGCTLAIPISKIDYLGEGVMQSYDDAAACAPTTSSGCDGLDDVCNAQPETDQFTYSLSQGGERLEILMPDSAQYRAPCELGGQVGNSVKFTYEKLPDDPHRNILE